MALKFLNAAMLLPVQIDDDKPCFHSRMMYSILMPGDDPIQARLHRMVLSKSASPACYYGDYSPWLAALAHIASINNKEPSSFILFFLLGTLRYSQNIFSYHIGVDFSS